MDFPFVKEALAQLFSKPSTPALLQAQHNRLPGSAEPGEAELSRQDCLPPG